MEGRNNLGESLSCDTDACSIWQAELLNDRKDAFDLIWNHNREIGKRISDKELREWIEKVLLTGNAIGVVADGHLIAFALLYCRHLETLQAYICNIFVLTEYRRNGLSRALLKKASETAIENGFKSIQLHVADDNYPAIKAYESFGFAPTGKCKRNSDINQLEMIMMLDD